MLTGGHSGGTVGSVGQTALLIRPAWSACGLRDGDRDSPRAVL